MSEWKVEDVEAGTMEGAPPEMMISMTVTEMAKTVADARAEGFELGFAAGRATAVEVEPPMKGMMLAIEDDINALWAAIQVMPRRKRRQHGRAWFVKQAQVARAEALADADGHRAF